MDSSWYFKIMATLNVFYDSFGQYSNSVFFMYFKERAVLNFTQPGLSFEIDISGKQEMWRKDGKEVSISYE